MKAEACFNYAVGVADPGIIPDNKMTATSQYNRNYPPSYGRLNENRGGSWCAKSSSATGDWLQVDLGKTINICGLATQGNGNGRYDEWVIDFRLLYSPDGSSWTTYLDTDGSRMVRRAVVI